MQFDFQHQSRHVQDIFNDLLKLNLGTVEQRRQALRSLWATHQNDWLTFIFFGDNEIETSIANDVTHTWLDNVVSGVTIRQRIIDRLGAV